MHPTDTGSRGTHVAHVLETLRAGGAEMAVRTLAPRTVALGTRTTLVSIYADRLGDAERRELEAGGVDIVTIGRSGRGDVAFFGRLVSALRLLRPDVVHAHVHAGKYAGRAAAIVARVPAIVYTAHGESTLDGADAYRTFERLGNRLLNPFTRRFVAFTDAQRATFARAERIDPGRVVVLPNGVPVPPAIDRAATRSRLDLPPEAVALYMPARLAAVKGHAVALEAVARLGERAAAWHLVFAGDGPEAEALRRHAERLGLAARSHWLGFRSDAAALTRAMDLFLLPSLQERMPLALGEAMHAGLAVVSTPWDGADDLVRDGETGYLARDGGAAAFADALLRAANDPRREDVVRRARALAAERFDVEAWARAHVALYREVA